MNDYFGVPFEEGQIITYPLRQGSALWIAHATIVSVNNGSLSIRKSTGKKSIIRNYFNCIIAPRNWTPEE